MNSTPDSGAVKISRRSMLKAGAALAGAPMAWSTVTQGAAPALTSQTSLTSDAGNEAPAMMQVTLQVNGRSYPLTLDSRTTVLDALRENLGMKGSKKGCDHGQCGACTVLIDDRRINACLTLAVMHEGQSITTIEGLSGLPKPDSNGEETLHPLQAAFLKHDGFQCGYCTPGQICSAVAMLKEASLGMPSHVSQDLAQTHTVLTDEEIRERMSGNLCRCSAYPNIVAAIRAVAGEPA